LHDAELCSGCGMHPVILADPERYQFTVEERQCEFCAQQEAYRRVVAARDETWHKTHPEPKPTTKQPEDGRRLIVRPKTAEEIEAEEARQRNQRTTQRKEGT
jgi:hypothetical protein